MIVLSRKIKTLALAAIVTMTGVSVSHAQSEILQDNSSPVLTSTPKEESVTQDLKLDRAAVEADRRAKMYAELDLNDDQIAAMDQVAAERKEATMAIKQDSNLNRDEKKTKLKSLREETLTTVQGILDTEQYAKYLEMAKKGRKAFGKRGKRGGRG